MNECEYRKGCLYQYDGTAFVELEPSQETKIPVSEEAAKAVRNARKAAHQYVGMRPELSLTASAMLLAAAELPDLSERIARFGVELYSRCKAVITEPEAVVLSIVAPAVAGATIETAVTEEVLITSESASVSA